MEEISFGLMVEQSKFPTFAGTVKLGRTPDMLGGPHCH